MSRGRDDDEERADARRERDALIQQRARELREEREAREREERDERDRARERAERDESLRAARELAAREGRTVRGDE